MKTLADLERYRDMNRIELRSSRRAEIVREWLQKIGPDCPYCGEQMHDFTNKEQRNTNKTQATIDHYRARAHGGTDSPGNLLVCCRACNEKKAMMEMVAAVRFEEGRGWDYE